MGANRPKRVYDWSEIADDFGEGLILGNGASIAFDKRFDYVSLLAEAGKRNLIGAGVQKVFDHLETKDFELVLRMLWHTSKINDALGVESEAAVEAYESVRNALIGVVRDIHVSYEDVRDRLPRAANFMAGFSTVASLSYDVLVYWSMLTMNRESPNRFKDCFKGGGGFEHDWAYLRTPFQGNDSATLIFYPHGNLALTADLAGTDRKIAADGVDLLTTIFAEWTRGTSTPLFVSEGTPAQKLAAIRRSPYLSNVLERVLPRMGESVVILGWRMGDSDPHLLNAVCQGEATRFAVAVDPKNRNLDESLQDVRGKIRTAKRGKPFELDFFDRSSSGCWINV